MRREQVGKVLKTLARFYGIPAPPFVVRKRSKVVFGRKVYGQCHVAFCSTGRVACWIEFYGEPELRWVLHEFAHYLHAWLGEFPRDRSLREKLAEEFVERWLPFFKKQKLRGKEDENC
ncbi:hypothetical protein DRO51_01495 [Candidatus Bathyarchaeota archaeon]|nr:MAG: hypothetical protein DRO51_01495 [Candidatus Bathyarchaeota archaeon]